MPLLDSALAQVIFAFVMIGLFAFVLRWTFSGSPSLTDGQPEDARPGDDAATPGAAGDNAQADDAQANDAQPGRKPFVTTDPVVTAGTSADPSPRDTPPGPQPRDVYAGQSEPTATPPTDDYGLLAPAAIVDSAEQAARVRELLGRAGIRATTTIGSDGRHRVLVFARDLNRARRLAK